MHSLLKETTHLTQKENKRKSVDPSHQHEMVISEACGIKKKHCNGALLFEDNHNDPVLFPFCEYFNQQGK